MSERKGTEVGEGGGNGGKGREGGVVGGWGRGERHRELKQPFALTFSSLHTYTHTHTHTHTHRSQQASAMQWPVIPPFQRGV